MDGLKNKLLKTFQNMWMKSCAKETLIRQSIFKINAYKILQHMALYRKDRCQRADGSIDPNIAAVLPIAGTKGRLFVEMKVYNLFTWFLTVENREFFPSYEESF